jgi:hypothetical protein
VSSDHQKNTVQFSWGLTLIAHTELQKGKRVSPIGLYFRPPMSSQRFHRHFSSLYENLIFLSKLADGTLFFKPMKNKSKPT